MLVVRRLLLYDGNIVFEIETDSAVQYFSEVFLGADKKLHGKHVDTSQYEKTAFGKIKECILPS